MESILFWSRVAEACFEFILYLKQTLVTELVDPSATTTPGFQFCQLYSSRFSRDIELIEWVIMKYALYVYNIYTWFNKYLGLQVVFRVFQQWQSSDKKSKNPVLFGSRCWSLMAVGVPGRGWTCQWEARQAENKHFLPPCPSVVCHHKVRLSEGGKIGKHETLSRGEKKEKRRK